MPADASQVWAFADRLARAANTIDRTGDRLGDKHGPILAREMKAAAPRHLGELESSIHHVGRGVVEVGAEHGIYQQYGTARHGPQPFATIGLHRVKAGYTKAAGQAAVGELLR